MSFIEFNKVSYDYEKRDEEDKVVSVSHAIKELDLKIEEGDFIAVVGHNGSGKSTFARLLNGLITPASGEILVDGLSTSVEDNIWNIRKNVGMVFQNPDNQIIATVVEEDVAFGPENLGVSSEDIIKRVSTCLKAVGMSEYAKKSPNRLSGGQKQRVAIAGALAMRPKCLVLDESTAMLDPSGRREVMRVIKRLNETAHLTVIYITHYMEEAAQAQRMLVLKKGSLVMDAAPREIFGNEEFVKEFDIELPKVTLLAKELRSEGVDIPEGLLTIDEFAEAIDNVYRA